MSTIQQSPAIRALGVELGQAIRRDRARRRRRLCTSGTLVLAVLAASAVLAHPFAGSHTQQASTGVDTAQVSASSGGLGSRAQQLLECAPRTSEGASGGRLGSTLCPSWASAFSRSDIAEHAPVRGREAPPPEPASRVLLSAEFWRHPQARLLN